MGSLLPIARVVSLLSASLLTATTFAQTNLVQNGSFEAPQFTGLTGTDGLPWYFYGFVPINSLPPWTNNSTNLVHRSRLGGWTAVEGNQYVCVESGYSGYYRQIVSTTAGASYRLTFWYAPDPSTDISVPADNAMSISWNGSVIDTVLHPPSMPDRLDWRLIDYTLTATGTTTELVFRDAGVYHGARGAFLDDVRLVRLDSAPIAEAGPDFGVSEGELAVLDGAGSSDPDGDPLSFSWTQTGGTEVTLSDAGSATPSFIAPLVPPGGETLTFRLAVTAGGQTALDTVNVTVSSVNHPPVADAGEDRSVVEGSTVTLNGTDSYDVDGDVLSHSWTQISGPRAVLSSSFVPSPIFEAPYIAGTGAPGVVAVLCFELSVADGLGGVGSDTVCVEVTNVNHPPMADAGEDQTVDENTGVLLSGLGSADPDGDAVAFTWTQLAGPTIVVLDAATACPSLVAPFVGSGGADLTLQLEVYDGYGGTSSDVVVVHVQNANDPPLVSAARPTVSALWPPNHGLVQVGISGVSDPDGDATITIDGIFQDEPTNGLGDGDTPVDAVVSPDGTFHLRAERAGGGNGRVYYVHFTAADLEGSASGVVIVHVPASKKLLATGDGELYDSRE